MAFTSSYSPTSSSISTTPLSTTGNSVHADPVGDTDRAEGIRQLWSAVRSRLGIGHGQPSSRRSRSDTLSSRNPVTPDVSANVPTLDTRSGPEVESTADAHNARERMLDEIARAFNLGFSSTPSPSSLPDVATDRRSVDQIHTVEGMEEEVSASRLPSADTFERFLLDLQVDLRSVLTGGGDQNFRERDGPANQESPLPNILHESEPEDDNDEGSMPSLNDVSDPDNDTEFDNIHLPSSDSSGSVSPTSEATPPRAMVSETVNGASISRPRVNYWRLYRFPPIPAARAHAAADNVAQNMRSGLGGLTRAGALASASAPAPRSSTSPSNGGESGVGAPPLSPQTPRSPGTVTAVVPVIIVGLQSVNPFWTMEPITIPTDSINENPMPSPTDDSLRSTPTPTPQHMPTSSTTGTTSQGTQTQSSNATPQNLGIPVPLPDSRTFLIYVIGGYYPPDHEIVTGTGENGVLDSSFEALLLLNELLNHHPFEMPLTVSKEQLDESGLEVIKGGQIQEWVKAGKVRSNCVEQCLICLDEYDQQDSVRVLECKHAFHMNCVDRWLLEGRNSCPACRGKGVLEGNEARAL
ncbi:hypothetical protein J3R30DRAFT_2177534 [Lentinula aciculospora]|uniref:RING-type domain-containing protein n=1 Tax=Lentinula aciculospora TaxID=153920 RepID=A0A9W9AH39_9AGAR|nr:hypothetical protein J3R30DRAFT_2177534 [Lentinula aciculospora]